jgi:hypothetical protein
VRILINIRKTDEIDNMDGSMLKLVLGTKAAGEGLNIYHVREVHVMEPWFHLNRLEQIVGRGIRNCSHTNLPAEHRNVSVFLYTVTEPKSEGKSSERDIGYETVSGSRRKNRENWAVLWKL